MARAMGVYDLATRRWLRSGFFLGVPPYDPATEGVVELDAVADVLTEVYDAASPTKTRPATPQERTAILEAAAADRAVRAVDRSVQTTVIWALTRMLGRAPTGAERQAAANEWRTIYRGLGE